MDVATSTNTNNFLRKALYTPLPPTPQSSTLVSECTHTHNHIQVMGKVCCLSAVCGRAVLGFDAQCSAMSAPEIFVNAVFAPSECSVKRLSLLLMFLQGSCPTWVGQHYRYGHHREAHGRSPRCRSAPTQPQWSFHQHPDVFAAKWSYGDLLEGTFQCTQVNLTQSHRFVSGTGVGWGAYLNCSRLPALTG